MGALVGGLYAANPNADLAVEYRSVMAAYVERTKQEKESAAAAWLVFCLLLGCAPLESGIFSAAASGAISESERRRLVQVLDEHFRQRTISELTVDFATWHDQMRSTLVKVRMNSGSLAEAIGDSIANPLIFDDVTVTRGAHLDPGADRVSAVPLDDACRLRPDAHFIVSNVTGWPPYVSAEMNCSYDEIRIRPPPIDARKAFAGEAPDFDMIVAAGFAAATTALNADAQEQSGPVREGAR
jgi:NTE family protein